MSKLSEVSSEMTFQLPTESAAQFKEFFNQLDSNLEALGIRSYGVGITTLEEVFLRIAKDGGSKEDESEEEIKSLKGGDQESLLKAFDDYSIAERHEEGAMNVFFQNLKALLKKKALLQVRDPRTLIIEMMFPIIFIFAGLALATIKPIREGVPRLLSPSIFPTPSHLYYNDMVPV